MSGRGLRIRLIDSGEEYELPEEEAFRAMDELERSGQKFDARSVPLTAAPPQPAAAARPQGGSVPGFEPDPNLDPYEGDPLSGLLHARDQDLALNDYVNPLERGAQALVGTSWPASPAGSYPLRMAGNFVSGAVQGGAAKYRETGDWYDSLLAARDSGLASAALTAGGKFAGQVGQKVAGAADDAGRWLNEAADTSRVRATGMPEDELEELGTLGRQEYAGDIEAAGMSGGNPLAGLRTYAREGKRVADEGRAAMTANENAIDALPQPPVVDVNPMIQRHRDEATRLSGMADRGNDPLARFRNETMDRLEADTIPAANPAMIGSGAPPGPTGRMPWSRGVEQRRNFDEHVDWNKDYPNQSLNETREAIANDMRGAVDEGLNDPNVPADLAAGWRTGRDQTALGLGVREDALDALKTPNPLNFMQPSSWMQAAGRAGGHSALAAGARGAGNMSLAAGSGMQRGANAVDELTNAGAGGMATAANFTLAGRGNMQAEAAMQLYQQDPEAFGEWGPEFQQALQRGPSAVNALIGRLEPDPNFRNGPYQQIRQLTVRGAQP